MSVLFVVQSNSMAVEHFADGGKKKTRGRKFFFRPQLPILFLQVFMPQQYNSPIGMYSAGNVIDTFQTQAEVRLQDMER